jgi:hypothetical protein
MGYQATSQEKQNEVVPDADHTIVWQTTNLTLNYTGPISYGGPTGDSTWFDKPSMELLPGTYWFHFRGCTRSELTFSGCSAVDDTCVTTAVTWAGMTAAPDGALALAVAGGAWTLFAICALVLLRR